ncbi:hypothetical protein BsWGS_19028 [Bradybaena similaris]
MLILTLLIAFAAKGLIESRCTRTRNAQGYPLGIGLLSASVDDQKAQDIFQTELRLTGDAANCFKVPNYINLAVNDTLMMPQHGWTRIESAISDTVSNGTHNGTLPNLVVGPFYVNLAMILQRMRIPYLVTDYKGFDWVDMNRVQDTVHWETVVEMRPSVQTQNQAVVDLFLYRNWKSAMMVMPESAADNQECQDLVGQLLSHSLSIIPYTVDRNESTLTTSLREFLINAKMYLQTKLLICSPRDPRDKLIEAVLKLARPFGILQDKDFSFILVDPSSSLIPISGAGNMYRLGLFSSRCELLAFRYVFPNSDDASSSSRDDATASDAASVTAYALSKYITSQKVVTDEYSSERFLTALKSVVIQKARTGHIQFDKMGQRTNYTLELYNHGGEDMYQLLARWDPSYPTAELRLNVTSAESKSKELDEMGIFPDMVMIVVVEERPFVMKRKPPFDSLEKNEEFEGFTMDLIKKLSEVLKFQYTVYQSPDNQYGTNFSDGTWDGMVGEIIHGNATLACGAISITSSREAVIDFSLGVISTGINMLVKRPKESFTIFQFMMPFSLELWMAIVGATATVSLVFFAMDYCSEDRRFTVRETIWFTVGTLLKRGSDFAPVPVSQRILTAGFLFFVLITVSTYTANMAAFLTKQNFAETVDSFEALRADESIGVSTVKNTATMDFLKKGKTTVYEALYKRAEKSNGLVVNATMGIRLVAEGKYAFIYDYLINEDAEKTDCRVMSAAPPILLQEHGIGMKAGAPFKSAINIALLKLKEEGFMSKLKKKWWDDKRRCDLGTDSQRTGQVQFSLDHTLGVFIVGLFGVCVSALLFLGKKITFLILFAWRRWAKNKEIRRNGDENIHDNNANDEAKREKHRLYEGEISRAI